MYTYEMVGVADQNNRTYCSPYGTYSKADGFKINSDVFSNEDYKATEVDQRILIEALINDLFHDDLWKIVKEPEPKKMTLADIEKELGYRVQITDPEYNKPAEEKKDLTKEQREEINDLVDLFKRIFDIDIDPKKYY